MSTIISVSFVNPVSHIKRNSGHFSILFSVDQKTLAKKKKRKLLQLATPRLVLIPSDFDYTGLSEVMEKEMAVFY